MQLKFDKSLQYQADAIDAVVNLFNGQELAQKQFEINNRICNTGVFFNDKGFANNLTISDEVILENLKNVQAVNELTPSSELSERSFSIEMETGTGKTYVYLRSIFELNKKYGFQKFIIVVPSIAIREGVLSSIIAMSEHFKELYNNAPFSHFVYDSSKLNNVREFAIGNEIKIMIMNIQSFQRDSDTTAISGSNLKKLNIINRENDKMQGYKPIEFIQSTNPIIIIDEPQSVDNTVNAKAAIARLNPLVTLRYSATHRESKNLIYQLDPVKAYEQRLVKRIEVASVREDNNFNDAYIKLLKLDRKKGIRAYVEIHKKTVNSIRPHKIWIKQHDNIYQKSAEHRVYQNNYIVRNIGSEDRKEYIEFNNGQILKLNQELGAVAEEIMKAQIRITIEQHLKKERQLQPKGIKVLSLFFIDKVENYRIYDRENNTTLLGKIGHWFEEEYNQLIKSTKDLQHLKNFKVEDLHNGYFSKDGRRTFKDTNGSTKDDEDTYRLIMSDKERLLDPLNPLRFIFSHTALKEGWDNPNVFQVCILREVGSDLTRRQQIGRGLRLPVNANGDRINDYDDSINRLTVIANESYEDFARNLQDEFESDGVIFSKNQIGNAGGRDTHTLRLNKQVFLSEDFTNLWDKIKQRTRYRVKFETDTLIERAVQKIKEKTQDIIAPSIVTSRHKLLITAGGIDNSKLHNYSTKIAITTKALPDIVTYLQEQTKLVRSTICEILEQADIYEAFKKNPQVLMQITSQQINLTKDELIFDNRNGMGIKYEKIGTYWDMGLIEKWAEEGIVRYVDDYLYTVTNKDKSIFDVIKCDSLGVEKQFAKDLDSNEDIKLFLKLPSWFVVLTPIGRYNPDWAFLVQHNDKEKLYLVCETKSTTEEDKLRPEEKRKLKCGEEHFKTIGTDFEVKSTLDSLLINLNKES